ncbi:MAG TPA: DNA ligase D [Vicinamibacteria bacterium]|nr:DNA ligase D [Vicinamibacteria bacterium]
MKGGKLERYRRKRSADRTPEPFSPAPETPAAEAAAAGAPAWKRPRLFCVQKHHARRLHYDFRLELGGVLRSWAVPRGLTADPREKRLAVEVEDHPVEYADFEGVIPEGNYGAGAVIVWDRGVWIPNEDPEATLPQGKLSFELRGHKLRGVFHLFRTKKQQQSNQNEWLLIKKPDEWAGAEGERALTPESIYSGLTLEELEAGTQRAGHVREELERLQAPRRPVAADKVELMLAEQRDAPFTAPGWLFELKYDGYRLLAEKDGDAARLLFRRGSEATAVFPEIARAVSGLPFARFVLDGEVVVLDGDARPRFQLLQQRALLQRSADIARASGELPATLYVFDLVGFEDFDLRPLPLVERKRLLRGILPRRGPLRYADHVAEQGEAFYGEVARLRLEGLLAKRADSSYRGGRSPHWLKVRVDRSDDFVVVGMSPPEGLRTGFGALHVATHVDGALVYAGRVGSGFDEKELRESAARLLAFRRATPACAGPVPKGSEQLWVEPREVVEVRYKEWTGDHLLRQPVFLRFRDDKRPEECVREEPAKAEATPPASSPAPERRVPFSNLDKVFWPEEGYTKGDLIEFYRAVAPWLLPFLKDRPLVLTRYPDGIGGKNFFQKDAPGFVPEWIRTERMWSENAQREIDYFVCDDLETLLYLANLGTIPLHIWSSRVRTLQNPDWTILDFDPKGAPFEHVVRLAREARALCDAMELPSFPKTSGATGLHVLIPLGRQLTYEQSRSLAELLARVITARHPDIATVARNPASRGGKVYVDFLQNGHGRLLVAPYSVRPRPGATVSTPLAWSEVSKALDPARFTIRTLPPRLEKKGDLLAGLLAKAPDLGRALARLAALVPE